MSKHVQHSESHFSIGVDVGGTNTDAVLLKGRDVVVTAKVSTTEDVTTGIVNAIKVVLSDQPPAIKPSIRAVMVGTTHLLNALVQEHYGDPVLVLRLAAPATTAADIALGWDARIRDRIVSEHSAIVSGGYEFNGDAIADINPEEIRMIGKKAITAGHFSVAITGVFAHVNPYQEKFVKSLLREMSPKFTFSLSHKLGGLGLLIRENATILNASLMAHYDRLEKAMDRALSTMDLSNATLFLSNSTGTIQPVSTDAGVHRSPLLTLNSGPTNSIRGAGLVADVEEAIVVDIGGTTTDVGLLDKGFPVMQTAPFHVTPNMAVTCHFPKPHTSSIGLGGGSLVVVDESTGGCRIGPSSVEYRLLEQSLFAGGDQFTVTDLAYVQGRDCLIAHDGASFLSRETVKAKITTRYAGYCKKYTMTLDQLIQKLDRILHELLKDVLVHVIGSTEHLPEHVLLVGGGAKLFNQQLLGSLLPGSYGIVIPENNGVVNAVGAGFAHLSEEVNRVYDYSKKPRAFCIQSAVMVGIRRLLDKHVSLESIHVAGRGLEEMYINYLSGDPNELRLTLIGELAYEDKPVPVSQIDDRVQVIMHSLGLKPVTDEVQLRDMRLEVSEELASPKRPEQQVGEALDAESVDSVSRDVRAIPQEARPRRFTGATRRLTISDIEDIEKGAALLGSGGGGSPKLGSLMAQSVIAKGGEIEVIGLSQLQDDARVITFGVMGSPTVLSERLPAYMEGVQAIVEIEKRTGEKIDALLIMEGGGTNATYPLFVAWVLGIPVIDADCMGRALPGINMVMPNIYGQFDRYYAAISDAAKADVIEATAFQRLENGCRKRTVEKGGIVSLAYIPMSGKQVKKKNWCVDGTLTVAQLMGAAIRGLVGKIDKKLAMLNRQLTQTNYKKAHKIATGRVVNIRRKEVGGFSVGGIRLLCEESAGVANRIIDIGFQNENLFVREIQADGELELAKVPNIITLVDANTFHVVSCEELAFGQHLVVLTIDVPAVLKTQKALQVIGEDNYPIKEIKTMLNEHVISNREELAGEEQVVKYPFKARYPEKVVNKTEGVKKVALLVSLGQPYYEGRQAKAIMDHLGYFSQTVSVDVAVADTLQVFNALDPWQLKPDLKYDGDSEEIFSRKPAAHWRIKEVKVIEELPTRDRGVITFFYNESTAILHYSGRFGRYSFLGGDPRDDRSMAIGKGEGEDNGAYRTFQGEIPLDSLPQAFKADEEALIACVLNDVARCAGKRWVDRNKARLESPNINYYSWDRWTQEERYQATYPAFRQEIDRLFKEDPIFQLMVLLKLSRYKQSNRSRETLPASEINFWKDDIYDRIIQIIPGTPGSPLSEQELFALKDLPNIVEFMQRPDVVRLVSILNDQNKPGATGYFSSIMEYILSETAILMGVWGEEYDYVLYKSNETELLFDYTKAVFEKLGVISSSPKWVPYEPTVIKYWDRSEEYQQASLEKGKEFIFPSAVIAATGDGLKSVAGGTEKDQKQDPISEKRLLEDLVSGSHPSLLVSGEAGYGKRSWMAVLHRRFRSDRSRVTHCFALNPKIVKRAMESGLQKVDPLAHYLEHVFMVPSSETTEVSVFEAKSAVHLMLNNADNLMLFLIPDFDNETEVVQEEMSAIIGKIIHNPCCRLIMVSNTYESASIFSRHIKLTDFTLDHITDYLNINKNNVTQHVDLDSFQKDNLNKGIQANPSLFKLARHPMNLPRLKSLVKEGYSISAESSSMLDIFQGFLNESVKKCLELDCIGFSVSYSEGESKQITRIQKKEDSLLMPIDASIKGGSEIIFDYRGASTFVKFLKTTNLMLSYQVRRGPITTDIWIPALAKALGNFDIKVSPELEQPLKFPVKKDLSQLSQKDRKKAEKRYKSDVKSYPDREKSRQKKVKDKWKMIKETIHEMSDICLDLISPHVLNYFNSDSRTVIPATLLEENLGEGFVRVFQPFEEVYLANGDRAYLVERNFSYFCFVHDRRSTITGRDHDQRVVLVEEYSLVFSEEHYVLIQFMIEMMQKGLVGDEDILKLLKNIWERSDQSPESMYLLASALSLAGFSPSDYRINDAGGMLKQVFSDYSGNFTDLMAQSVDKSSTATLSLYQKIQGFKRFTTDISRPGSDGTTPLFHAISHGNMAMVLFLLIRGAKVSDRNFHPLHQAIGFGRLPILIKMIGVLSKRAKHFPEQSPDVILETSKSTLNGVGGINSLMLAVVSGSLDMFLYMYKQHPQLIDAVDEKKRTICHYAAAQGSQALIDAVNHELKDASTWDAKDCSGMSANDILALELGSAARKQVLETYPKMKESSIKRSTAREHVTALMPKLSTIPLALLGRTKSSVSVVTQFLTKWFADGESQDMAKVIAASLESFKASETHRTFTDRVARHGLSLHDVQRDGNCYFHAVLDQLRFRAPDLLNDFAKQIGLNPEEFTHHTLRQLAVGGVIILAERNDDSISAHISDMRAYISGVARDTVWADQVLTSVLARVLGVTIVLVNSDQDALTVISSGGRAMLYLGYEVHRHFQSTKGDPTQDFLDSIAPSMAEEGDLLDFRSAFEAGERLDLAVQAGDGHQVMATP